MDVVSSGIEPVLKRCAVLDLMRIQDRTAIPARAIHNAEGSAAVPEVSTILDDCHVVVTSSPTYATPFIVPSVIVTVVVVEVGSPALTGLNELQLRIVSKTPAELVKSA